MRAETFRAGVESGEVPVDRHDRVLRITFTHLDEGLWNGNVVRGWVPELGSEEEIAFLAAVAARETEAAGASSDGNVNLDYASRGVACGI
ncbi:uncharacterized protein GLRG_09695 [Colletotrichum graminicola M1.001]|uniref:Uncharacterized protein n=1 Tax=Colletotrichum graminicola (strain M1.001 / M2 / FGSC 10212) TaxID=645133 RepID=E3QUL3_COLGM|nr:uncharacterized protein GLRG_09695 [Colletotrichum graminicola M1.001]EFQ34551.1 hypothetical protein GLRG_09695 [Colletotrichum graminicola M1.001]